MDNPKLKKTILETNLTYQAYLKRRLQDFYIDQRREQATTLCVRSYQSTSGDRNETIDPIDNLPATPLLGGAIAKH